MSGFGGNKKSKTKPQFTGLQTQTSTSALPIGLFYGRNRAAPNIIWQGDFKAHKHKQKVGKGGGGSVDFYTYSASFELGLCWGPIHNIVRVWKDQSKQDDYTKLGFSLFTGTTPQSPWGYLTSAHPSQALGYPGIAYLAVANYDLGQSNVFPQHSFEYEGLLWNTAAGSSDDADVALMINDFLGNVTYGVGMDISIIDQDTLLSTPDATTTGDSSFQTYCTAMGFGLSPAMVSQQKAGDIIEHWAQLCNSAIVWTGYSLKFYPYGPDTITANGVTYIPNFPVRYELTYADFHYSENEDPIRFNRTDPADAFNALSMVIANKNNEFNDLPVPWKDQGLVDQFGLRRQDTLEAKEITNPNMAAIVVALIGQRKAYIRNTFEFSLPPKFSRLEPMDVVSCSDPMLGTFYVLINEINESDDDMLSITAEEYPSSVSGQTANVSQDTSNTPVDTAVEAGPVNPPIIFEPPSSLSAVPQVWAAVSGGDGTDYDPNWGGCYVYVSTDNITFDQIGQVDNPARQGKLTATLATYGGSNPDTVHTLSVDLSMSNGDLADASSSADAAAGVTISYVDGELIAYETVTLTGTLTDDLTTLYRGLYGSTIGSHGIGTEFARLDDDVFKWDLPAAYIGIPLYLKFQSYNIFGQGTEDLSGCTTYNYTPLGTGFGGGTDGVPTEPTGLSTTPGIAQVVLTWNANPSNDNVTSYRVYRATGAGQPFSSSILVADGISALTWTDTGLPADQDYTYFLEAVNVVGASTATPGVDATTSAVAIDGIRLYGSLNRKPDAAEELFDIEMNGDEFFAAGLPYNLGSTDIAATADSDFPIYNNGVQIGHARVSAASTTMTWVMASDYSPAQGDHFKFAAPTVQDATLSGPRYTFIGRRV